MMECGGVTGSCGSRAFTGNVGAPSKGTVEGAAMQTWAGRGIRLPPTEEEEVFGEFRAPGEAERSGAPAPHTKSWVRAVGKGGRWGRGAGRMQRGRLTRRRRGALISAATPRWARQSEYAESPAASRSWGGGLAASVCAEP